MRYNSRVLVGIPWNIHINVNVCGQWTLIALPISIMSSCSFPPGTRELYRSLSFGGIQLLILATQETRYVGKRGKEFVTKTKISIQSYLLHYLVLLLYQVVDSEAIKSGRIKVQVRERAEPVCSVHSTATPYRTAHYAASHCGNTCIPYIPHALSPKGWDK
jgi:hypothetical protein